MDAEIDRHKKFWDALLEHSNNKTDKNAAKNEWTALSKDANKCDLKGGLAEDLIEHYQIDVEKLPERVHNCICSHWIKKNKFIYNMYNKKLLTVGSHCIRRYLSYTTKKLCRECKSPFIPEGRRGRRGRGKSRDYCSSCKSNWCMNRGYRRRGFKWISRRGRSIRANFCNVENFSATPSEGRESEFCGQGTSMSYNPSATLNRNRQSDFFGSVTSKSEFRTCGTSVSSNPKATPIKEQQSEFYRCSTSVSCYPKATPNKEHQNVNLIQQVQALKFTNKDILFKYLESQEYLQGTKTINFGKYSGKPLKDFNDPSYYNWFTETIKKPYDEQLAFYFYVTYINKKF